MMNIEKINKVLEKVRKGLSKLQTSNSKLDGILGKITEMTGSEDFKKDIRDRITNGYLKILNALNISNRKLDELSKNHKKEEPGEADGDSNKKVQDGGSTDNLSNISGKEEKSMPQSGGTLWSQIKSIAEELQKTKIPSLVSEAKNVLGYDGVVNDYFKNEKNKNKGERVFLSTYRLRCENMLEVISEAIKSSEDGKTQELNKLQEKLISFMKDNSFPVPKEFENIVNSKSSNDTSADKPEDTSKATSPPPPPPPPNTEQKHSKSKFSQIALVMAGILRNYNDKIKIGDDKGNLIFDTKENTILCEVMDNICRNNVNGFNDVFKKGSDFNTAVATFGTDFSKLNPEDANFGKKIESFVLDILDKYRKLQESSHSDDSKIDDENKDKDREESKKSSDAPSKPEAVDEGVSPQDVPPSPTSDKKYNEKPSDERVTQPKSETSESTGATDESKGASTDDNIEKVRSRFSDKALSMADTVIKYNSKITSGSKEYVMLCEVMEDFCINNISQFNDLFELSDFKRAISTYGQKIKSFDPSTKNFRRELKKIISDILDEYMKLDDLDDIETEETLDSDNDTTSEDISAKLPELLEKVNFIEMKLSALNPMSNEVLLKHGKKAIISSLSTMNSDLQNINSIINDPKLSKEKLESVVSQLDELSEQINKIESDVKKKIEIKSKSYCNLFRAALNTNQINKYKSNSLKRIVNSHYMSDECRKLAQQLLTRQNMSHNKAGRRPLPQTPPVKKVPKQEVRQNTEDTENSDVSDEPKKTDWNKFLESKVNFQNSKKKESIRKGLTVLRAKTKFQKEDQILFNNMFKAILLIKKETPIKSMSVTDPKVAKIIGYMIKMGEILKRDKKATGSEITRYLKDLKRFTKEVESSKQNSDDSQEKALEQSNLKIRNQSAFYHLFQSFNTLMKNLTGYSLI